MEKREFYVDTPLGKLHVYAKTEDDNPDDFPGVYVDLIREGRRDELLACVEYHSFAKIMESCLYDVDVREEPVVKHPHTLEEE